ncbi:MULTISPECIES: hypothetical protein [Moorena]|uniref:Uncharacterized protein n=1 Tax=Moorena producens 3L TaxID=489825 RepID=F4XMR1_9CYAN|nr:MULTISPECIES: hypothetical protein [Moorena]NEP29991.1 hypothetical protein [Moorena sp. SIO3B2]NEQ09886.1 hypothetical protein [Moorena sp. SIO4E2]NEQ15987.1 hypothetical protein [Moorena sp. SIO3E2]NES80276.1 hypothetical protein [Moorena sp. SIO2B7]EGJ33970.1 hypothetical protein LYNGBM3L_20430 [Moorena producens 3L]
MLKAYVESKQLSQFRQPVSEIPLTGTLELAQGNASHTTENPIIQLISF